MNLSQITATLREIHVSPVKSLGQNFLHDQNLIRWIIEQADVTSDDYVVEIGPGLGALVPVAACFLVIHVRSISDIRGFRRLRRRKMNDA